MAEFSASVHCDDGSASPDNGMMEISRQLIKAMNLMGRPPCSGTAQLREYLENAGFVDVQVFSIKQPLSNWPEDKKARDVGAMTLITLMSGIEAYAMAALTRALGMGQAEAEKLCEDALAAVTDTKNHIYNYL